MNRTDIYQHKKRLEQEEKHLERAEISERNKRIIQKFRNYEFMQGFSIPRIVKYYKVLRQLAKMMGQDFDKAKREDIERVVFKINSREGWSIITKYDVKVMLKRFYKWLKGNDEEYPKCVKWLKPQFKRSDRKLPNEGELLTEEEVQKVIGYAQNLRDKALISSLYESGCRVGELSSLRIRDVGFDKLGTVLAVTGKTGPRKIRIVSSTPYLANWIDTHPLRDNRDSPLWICIGNVNKHQKMNYHTIRMMLKKLFVKARIDKKHNPHLFRHSRATFLANHLTEFQMNQYFGWVQGSNMPSTYVHLSGKDIDNIILKINGKAERKEEKPIHNSITCKRCNTINTAKSIYCRQCGCAVDAITALKLEQEQKQDIMFEDTSKETLQRLIKEKPEMFMEMMQGFMKAAKGGA